MHFERDIYKLNLSIGTKSVVFMAMLLTANSLSANEALIRMLVERGNLSQEEAAAISKQAPTSIKPTDKAVDKLNGGPQGRSDFLDGEYDVQKNQLVHQLVLNGYLTQREAASITHNATVYVEPKSKAVNTLIMSGRLHYQLDYLDGESNGKNVADASHFYFRRLRWGAKAYLGQQWAGVINLDFSESSVAVDKAYAIYEHSDLLILKLGYFKAPFGLEETTSSSKIRTVERSAPNRFFADDLDFAGRHAGISVQGTYRDQLSYEFMFANAAQGQGSKLGGATNANNQLAVFGRIQYGTTLEDTHIIVGVDGGYQSDNLNGSGIEEGSDFRGTMSAATVYGQISRGGLFIQPEVFMGTLDPLNAGSNQDSFGYAILAAYNFGKVEPVFRYAYLNSDTAIDTEELIRRAPSGVDNGGTSDDIHSFFFGINNYFKGNDIKLSTGYEWAESEGAGVKSRVHGFRSRLQLLF